MGRPGFVHEVDRSTPPVLFWRGENFSLEKLPAGRSRVIYPPEPLPALKDIDGHIRHALLNPHDQDPLPALLFPGMKLSIAFDDVSLPLPKMRRPDLRQRIIEQVLTMAADAGVDDVHIIAALALHRRMHEFELRHALGDRRAGRVRDGRVRAGRVRVLLAAHDGVGDGGGCRRGGGDADGRLRADLLQAAGAGVGQLGLEQPFLMDQHEVDVTVGGDNELRVTGDFNLKTGEESALRVNVMVNEADNAGANDPGVKSVRQIYNHYKKFGIATEVMGASFRNVGQITALAGCDLLTISPDLLAALATSDAPLQRALDPSAAQAMDLPAVNFDEVQFRFALNQDAMATEKLAEGIRAFCVDAEKLEQLMLAA